MEVRLIYVQGSKEPWLESAESLYLEKIKPYLKITITKIRSSKFERHHEKRKIAEESEAILRQIQPDEYLIVMDELGKRFTSLEFSRHLQTKRDSGVRHIVMLIGGAFGLSAEIKARANLTLNLSSMTMNHHVARLVVLEQIYRAMMISKNKPYHNE